MKQSIRTRGGIYFRPKLAIESTVWTFMDWWRLDNKEGLELPVTNYKLTVGQIWGQFSQGRKNL